MKLQNLLLLGLTLGFSACVNLNKDDVADSEKVAVEQEHQTKEAAGIKGK